MNCIQYRTSSIYNNLNHSNTNFLLLICLLLQYSSYEQIVVYSHMVKHLEAICHLEGVGKKGNPQDFAYRDKFSPGLTGATVVGFARLF